MKTEYWSFLTVDEKAVCINIGGPCPCGDGRIVALDFLTKKMKHEGGAWHRMPLKWYTVDHVEITQGTNE